MQRIRLLAIHLVSALCIRIILTHYQCCHESLLCCYLLHTTYLRKGNWIQNNQDLEVEMLWCMERVTSMHSRNNIRKRVDWNEQGLQNNRAKSLKKHSLYWCGAILLHLVPYLKLVVADARTNSVKGQRGACPYSRALIECWKSNVYQNHTEEIWHSSNRKWILASPSIMVYVSPVMKQRFVLTTLKLFLTSS